MAALRFSLFDVFYFFLNPFGWFVLGSWALLAPYWAESFFAPGLDSKVYENDPLNEFVVKHYALALLVVIVVFTVTLRRAAAAGDARTTSALLAAVGVASAVATGIVYGLFHRSYNPSLAVGPCLVLFNLVLHAALSAFFIWRYWSGQAPVQPQPAGSRPNDVYTIFFIYVKPALWMIVNAIALVWPRQVLQWAVPAFLGTTAAPIYENPATICYFRVGSILALAASACVPLGLARADADTTRRSFVAKTAFLIALIWNYGNMLRRYPVASLASAPVVVLALLVADALSNAALLHASGASKSAPAAGPAPYAYA